MPAAAPKLHSGYFFWLPSMVMHWAFRLSKWYCIEEHSKHYRLLYILTPQSLFFSFISFFVWFIIWLIFWKFKGYKLLQIEDGDAIDCVDIYQQPAFDHPLLKNHTIQVFCLKFFFSLQVIYVIFSIRNFLTGGLNVILKMKPSSYPSGIKADDSQAKLFQPWHGHGKCPEGTIPIFRRTRKHDHHHHSVPLNPSATPRNHSFLEGVSYSEVLFQL